MTVYARFKYEKLSLFCFICGKLGHGESFCPYRLRIEASKIVYGWDLSLRADPRRRRTVVSRWLRDVDGSGRLNDFLESANYGNSFKDGHRFRNQMEGNMENQSVNPNFIPLGVNQQFFHNRQNDPIPIVDGKKRQRVVVGESDLSISMAGTASTTLSASSGGQSSRCDGFQRGIVVGMKGNALASVLSFSAYHIDVEVNDTMCEEKWRLTGFYGNLDEKGRSDSWKLLRQLSNINNTPWVVLGDFNEIANSFEKQGGRRRPERQMSAFRTALEDCNLFDIGFTGRWFTWERGKFRSTNIRERLDRGVASNRWLELFLNARIEHLTHSFSDHCPILLNTLGEAKHDLLYNFDNFLFEAKWCLDSSFENLVRGWWADSTGSIPDRLEDMGHIMYDWSRNSKKDEKRMRVCLGNRLYYLFTQDISDDTLAEIIEVQLELNLEADKEELYWEQRVNWLKNGDRNTSFFHKMAGQQKVRNRIAMLENDIGNSYSTNEDMIKVAQDYFEKLFSASEAESDDRIFGLVEKRVTDSMNDSLNKAFIEEEICTAVKTMPPLKAPRIDGFVATFFQSAPFIENEEEREERALCTQTGHEQGVRSCGMGFPSSNDESVGFPRLMAGFSTILEEAKQKGRMRGAPIGRERFSINHLFFTDDCILFGDAIHEGVNTVRDIIREYELSTGQKVNYDKSLIYFGSNVKGEVKGDITRILGVRMASSPEKYFSLPMMVGRRKAWAFASFKDRFRKCVDGWSLRYLSMGGKEVFIKSILQATPLYAMQCFLFPKTLCSQLENIMNKFWWSNNKLKSGIHWSCWDKLCLPKFDVGLGFKKLVWFNKALLAKQVWRVLTQPQSLLARVLKARYFLFTDILAAKIDSYPSFTWWSICSARELIEDGLLWRIGRGDRVNIWNAPWLPGRENNRLSGHDIRIGWTTVNQLMQSDSTTWNDELIRSLFDEETASRIRSIPFVGSSLEDTLVWKFEGSGAYSVRSGYRVLSSSLVQATTSNPYHVWNCLQIQTQFVEESGCAKRIFTRAFAAAENQKQCIIAISLWSLWFRHNKLIHEGVKFQLEEVVDFIRGYAQEILLVHTNSQIAVKHHLQDHWKAPEVGFIKINFDASFVSKDRRAVTAVIARNCKGTILGVETYLFEDIADPFTAEARACERALLFAKAKGFPRLEVEGDSLSVIKSVKKMGMDNSVIRSITHHIYLMGLSFEQISYRFTPRALNGMAHALTLEGRRTGYFGDWIHQLPASVMAIASKEGVQTVLDD
ncbi:reverse transcriptase [Gossypium australe]|uniref:Reverse transcriptase n=1 Tax=Gossypium australe TaxID=47621 RepID=A0A5B6U9C3_9ROSI|nr:reverse transcriptase [Gossypium australe]